MGFSLRSFDRYLVVSAVLSISLIVCAFYVFRHSAPEAGATADSFALKLEALAPEATSETRTIPITAGVLTRMMEEDVSASADYLTRLRSARGPEAALSAEAIIRSYYQRRLLDLAAPDSKAGTLDVQVVTVGGRLSFSAVSFDGSLTPKDPVSVLFFGHATVDGIYQKLTSGSNCEGASCPPVAKRFLDQDGLLGADELRPCRSQTQWVLMGSSDGPLEWHMNQKGLMWQDGGCAAGTRDHVRLFGEANDPEFGSWVLATPHREEWVSGLHVVRSWEAPLTSFVDNWSARGQSQLPVTKFPDTTLPTWVYCQVKSQGLYQNVTFDGRAAVVAVP